MTSTNISDNKKEEKEKEKKNSSLKGFSVKYTISFNGKPLQQYFKYYYDRDYWLSFLEIVV